MHTKPTLLVMAAGMGSRYGGLKQVEGFGPSGETLLEYAIYDALDAGFGKVVFIIRRDMEALFTHTVLRRLPPALAVTLAFQGLEDALPPGFSVPSERTRPWGTGHAVLCAREVIEEPFAVINADDFYGRSAFSALGGFLGQTELFASDWCMVAYPLASTLSVHGSVARGIVRATPQGWLTSVLEHTGIAAAEGEGITGTPAQAEASPVSLAKEAPASMNCWGFSPVLFPMLEEGFARFIAEQGGQPKAEFYLPAAVDDAVRHGKARVRVLEEGRTWFGVTHADDRPVIQKALQKSVEAGEYPVPLWGTPSSTS